MRANAVGLLFTAASDAAVAAFDRAVDEYLAFGRDTGRHLKEALTADAEMVMAHVLRGSFFNLMALPALLTRAKQALIAAQSKCDAATTRERMHVAALSAWCEGRLDDALQSWEAILLEHPRDVLALKLANHLHFYLGDSAGMRDSVARVLHAWDPSVSGYGYVLGLHAFGLEETGDYHGAEEQGRKAVEINPRDAWGVHAVAHVMDSQDRYREGIEWIRSLEPCWNASNNFRYHLWWHRALMHLARGENEEALALYDERMWDPASDEYLDLCNDTALLARLELTGVDVGERWQALADKVEKQVDTRILAFIDVHYVLALAAAGRHARARQVLEALAQYARGGSCTTAQVTAEVGHALCDAMVAWRKENFARAVACLAPACSRLQRIGGSHTQRDLITQIFVAAAIGAGRFDLARGILAERTALRQNSFQTWRLYASVLEHSGDASAATAARARAAELAAD
jgi:tetratricopeptide (TPR) repeat protein